MKIAIDCRYIRERPSGIGTYVEALVDRLPALAPEDEFLLWTHRHAPRPLTRAANATAHLVRPEPNALGPIMWPQRYASFDGVDVFHSPHNILPRSLPCRSVVTVQDILDLEAPHLLDRTSNDTIKSLYYPHAMSRALRQATRLITTTNAMADAVLRRFPQARSRIVVIPLAARSIFVPPPNQETARDAAAKIIGSDEPFFLVVGQNSRSKQHHIALEAFARAASASSRLVLLQRQDSGRGLRQLAHRLQIAARVTWLGAIELEEMIALYQSAEALIHPSLYEGFGLPVIEAMACGCPVIASNLATLREVIGDAAIFVSPTDVRAFAQGIDRLLRDREKRSALTEAARTRAGSFTWERCAEETLHVYRDAAAAAEPT